MFWRIDRDWKQSRVEIPWVERPPTDYLPDHVRFMTQPEDARSDGVKLEEELVRILDAERMLIYGSHYPFWDDQDARTVMSDWSADIRGRILSANALDWIPRLRAFAGVPAASGGS
jgi:hypothetical protein